MKRGFVVILYIFLLFVVLVALIFIFSDKDSPITFKRKVLYLPSPSPSASQYYPKEISFNPDSATANWETIGWRGERNVDFKFKFPPQWKIESTSVIDENGKNVGAIDSPSKSDKTCLEYLKTLSSEEPTFSKVEPVRLSDIKIFDSDWVLRIDKLIYGQNNQNYSFIYCKKVNDWLFRFTFYNDSLESDQKSLFELLLSTLTVRIWPG